MKVVWMILAGACGVLAVYFAVRENYENAFVAAAAGAVCWLLNYRQQLREWVRKENEPKQEDEQPDEEIHS